MSFVAQGENDTLTIGGRRMINVKNLKCLLGETTTTNSFCTLRETREGSGYQVPVGKKFVVCAIRYMSNTASQNSYGTLGYGDTDVGFSSSSAPTNAVEINALTATPTTGIGAVQEAAYAGELIAAPAGKYLYANDENAAAGASFHVYGYEVTV